MRILSALLVVAGLSLSDVRSASADEIFLLDGSSTLSSFVTQFETGLDGFGHNTTTNATLPSDLSGFDAIWVFTYGTALSNTDRDALIAFVQGGGGLVLLSDLGQSAVYAVYTEIINTVTTAGGVGVSSNTASPPNVVNPNAAGGITQNPNVYTTHVDTSGGEEITGATGANVMVTGDMGRVRVAVWGPPDMINGQGRIILFGDVTWPTNLPLMENIQTFGGGSVSTCGNGSVESGEDCDGDGAGTGGETATCNDDCSAVQCGDGNTNEAAGETCDDSGESATCDDDCTAVQCGDGNINQAAGETCDGGPECSSLSCLMFDAEDLDSDNVYNVNDNCPFVANTGQEDSDSDGIGDACESSNEGDKGEKGDKGDAGANGSLSRLTKLEIDEGDCAAGGVRISVGRDADGDGDLSDSEVQHTEVVCDSQPSQAGATSVIDVVALKQSSDCPDGGVTVRVGLDDGAGDHSSNGKLDKDELDFEHDVCLSAAQVVLRGAGTASSCAVRQPGTASPSWSLALLAACGLVLRRRRSRR